MTIPARLQDADQITMSPNIGPIYLCLDGDMLIYSMCDRAARILAEFEMLKDQSSASAAFNKAGGSEM